MSTAFISQDIWPQLKKAIRNCRQPCNVAVAYFGKGASKLLPLTEGSRLVVDASEAAVKGGQTYPPDLLTLVRKGVAVYSVSNLHAKVYVLGRSAFIGSANASRHSEAQLVEALIRTTEPETVRAARKFVEKHCLHQLTPTLLKKLEKLYRPPRVPGGKPNKRNQVKTADRPSLPRLLVAQLDHVYWSDHEQALHDAGLGIAEQRRKRGHSFELDSFRWTGRCPYQPGDVIIQVTNMGNRSVLVTPPGNVLYVRTTQYVNRQVSFVYLERPTRRRRSLKSLGRQLGHGSIKRLQKQGIIRDASFAEALLNLWAN